MVYPYTKTPPNTFTVIDGTTSVNSALFKKFSNAIIRLEDELGLKPSGTYSTVRARLDAMEVAGDTGSGASPHSTTLATHYRHDWVSPTITTPSGPATLATVIGQVPVNVPMEASFPDGYGLVYFTNRFYVDADVQFTLELWEVTSTPTQLTSTLFTYGEHTLSVIIALPLTTSINRIYELRCFQTSIVATPRSTNSILWNSRFLFVPTNPVPFTNELAFVTVDFGVLDVIAGEKTIGTIGAPHAIQSVSVIINTAFNGATTMEVGDSLDNDRLMTTADNTPSIISTYNVNSAIIYTGSTETKIYFTGAPTTGTGRVIVYFH